MVTWTGGGEGLLGGWILRKVGGIFVDVGGEEVLHCGGVEHGGCWVRLFWTGVVEGAGLGIRWETKGGYFDVWL